MAEPTGGGGNRRGSGTDKKSVSDTNNLLQQQILLMSQLRESMAAMTSQMEKFCEISNKCFSGADWKKATKDAQDYSQETEIASKATAKLGQEISSTTSRFQKLAPVIGGVVGATKGLQQGFTNLFALGKASFNFGATVSKSMFNIGASIAAIPFKMLKGLTNLAHEAANGMNELAQAMEDLRKEFGFIGPTSETVKDLAFNMQGFGATGLSTYRVFGNAAERVKYFTEMAKGMGAQFQLNAKELQNNGGAIAAYQKGLGITHEQMASISMAGQRMGKSMTTVMNDMTKHALHMSKAFGLDAKVLSKDMTKAMGDFKNFGHLTVKQIAEAVTYSNKLGVSIDKLTNLMDQFDTFDKAAESAAGLNEQFNTNIDAMELMTAQTPTEKFEILRKGFAATGRDLKDLNYAEKKYIQTKAGLTDEAFNAMIANQDQGDMLKQVAEEGEKAEKTTLDQVDALKQLSTQIERLIKSGMTQPGGFLDRLFGGFMMGIKATREYRHLMRNINMSLYHTGRLGVDLARIFVKAFPPVKMIFEGLTAIFNPQHFAKLANDVSRIVRKFLGPDGELKGSVSDMMSELKTSFFDFFTLSSPGAQKVLEGFKKFGQFIVKVLGSMLEAVVNKLPEIINAITAWIKNPKLPKLDGNIDKAWYQPLLDVIKTIPDKLGPALKDLGIAIWERIKQGLTSKVGMGIVAGAVGVVLAPALIQGLAGAGAGGAISGAIDKFKGLFGKKTAAVAEAAGGVSRAASASGAAAGGGAAAAAANDTISSAAPSNSVIETLKAVSEMKISWNKLVKFFIGFAGFIAIGLKGFVAALDIVKGVALEDLVKAGLVLVAVGKSLEMMAPTIQSMATGFWQSVSWTSIGQTLAAIAGFLTVGLMAFAGALYVVSGVSITDVIKAGLALTTIGFIMMLMGPVLLEAAGIGKLAEKYKKEMAVGMLAMGLAVDSIAVFARLAIEALGSVSASEIAKTVAVMTAMVPLFGATGLLLVEAAGVGALITLTEGAGAVAMAAGMAAMGLSVMAIAKVGEIIVNWLGRLPMSKIIKSMAIMAAMVKLFDETSDILLKAGAIGGGIVATFGVGALALYAGMKAIEMGMKKIVEVSLSMISQLGDVPMTKVLASASVMAGMVALFVAAGGILLEAGSIGTTIIGTFGLAGAAIVVGMEAIQYGIDALVNTAVGILNRLSDIKEDPTAMKTKADAFSSIVSAIAKLMDSLSGILDEMDFSFWEGADTWAGKFGAVQGFIEVLIRGERGNGGIIGIVESITMGLKEITKEQLEASQAFAGILGSLAKLMEVMTGPAMELQNKSSHWYQSAEKDAAQAKVAIDQLQDYIKVIATETKGLVSTVVSMLKDLTKEEVETLKNGGQAVGSILGAVSQLMQALKAPNISASVKGGEKLSSTDAVINVTIPSMKETLLAMKENMPGVVEALKSVVQGMPTGEEFLKKIESAKKIFEAFSPLSEAIKSIIESAKKDDEKYSAGDLKEKLSEMEVFFWDLTKHPGTFNGVLYYMQQATAGITDPEIYTKIADNVDKTTGAVKDVFEKIVDFENFDVPDSDKIKDNLKELTGYFFRVNEFLPGLLFQIIGVGNKMSDNIETIKLADEHFKNFNESMAIMSDTMTSMSDLRDKIEDGSFAASDIAYSIEDLNRSMERVELIMSSARFQGAISTARAIKAVSDMVTATQKLDDALARLPRIDIAARLKQVAGMMGVGASGVYTVKSKDVIVNVSFKITMETDKIEKVILQSANSVIRRSINWANKNVGYDAAAEGSTINNERISYGISDSGELGGNPQNY